MVQKALNHKNKKTYFIPISLVYFSLNWYTGLAGCCVVVRIVFTWAWKLGYALVTGGRPHGEIAKLNMSYRWAVA